MHPVVLQKTTGFFVVRSPLHTRRRPFVLALICGAVTTLQKKISQVGSGHWQKD
jgi:hypothetical protein